MVAQMQRTENAARLAMGNWMGVSERPTTASALPGMTMGLLAVLAITAGALVFIFVA